MAPVNRAVQAAKCHKRRIFIKTRMFLFLLFLSTTTFGFQLYGHRGARGLFPENTLPAYQAAIQLGVDYVDLDIVMTKDKIWVVHHDLMLNPNITRDKNKQWITKKILIKNLTYQQLRKYDVGRLKANTTYANFFPNQQSVDNTIIPTLKNVIQFVKKHSNKIGFQIEIKTDPIHPQNSYSPGELAKALVKILRDEKIVHRTQVQSFDWRCLTALQKIDPHITTAYLTNDQSKKVFDEQHLSLPDIIKVLGGTYWDPEDRSVTLKDIKKAHQLGLKVVVWSTPESSGKDMNLPLTKRLIAFGVDGVITDRPDVVKGLQQSSQKRVLF